jgi:hypothetical protein
MIPEPMSKQNNQIVARLPHVEKRELVVSVVDRGSNPFDRLYFGAAADGLEVRVLAQRPGSSPSRGTRTFQ